jgi:hypothetical protein
MAGHCRPVYIQSPVAHKAPPLGPPCLPCLLSCPLCFSFFVIFFSRSRACLCFSSPVFRLRRYCLCLSFPSLALATGFLFRLGADWSGALVRPEFAGPWRLVLSQMALSHKCWGRRRWRALVSCVMGAHCVLCSFPAASDVTTARTTIWGRGRYIPLLV